MRKPFSGVPLPDARHYPPAKTALSDVLNVPTAAHRPWRTAAAPNPFWGICTLVICRPGIRRAAKAGDWIVGTGSSNSPIGDISDRMVYAMRVSQKITMQEYDTCT